MNLHFFILGFISHFSGLELEKKIIIVSGLIFFIFGILGILILPMIFNFFIYPKVEKRLGMRLIDWGLVIQIQPFGKYFLSPRIFSMYVVRQYFMLKFAKNFDVALEKWASKKRLKYDLARGGYDIREAAKFEIVMSFVMEIYTILMAIDMLILSCMHFVLGY